MQRNRSVMALLLFLGAILFAWWCLSYFHGPLADTSVKVNSPETPRTMVVYHSSSKGIETYQGEILLSSCVQVITNFSTQGMNPIRITISFTTKEITSCTPSAPISTPFTITLPTGASIPAPVLASVLLNNTAAAFSVTETP